MLDKNEREKLDEFKKKLKIIRKITSVVSGTKRSFKMLITSYKRGNLLQNKICQKSKSLTHTFWKRNRRIQRNCNIKNWWYEILVENIIMKSSWRSFKVSIKKYRSNFIVINNSSNTRDVRMLHKCFNYILFCLRRVGSDGGYHWCHCG